MKIFPKSIKLNNGAELLIRTAVKSDAAELLGYLKEIGSESDYLSFGFEGAGSDIAREEEFITRMAAAPSSALIVGITDKKIVADFTLSADGRSRFSHNADVGCSVLKKYWRQGIATAMFGELIEAAKVCGYLKVLRLTVVADNKRAIGLYDKVGFREIGRLTGYFKVNGAYSDALFMEFML